MYIGMYVFPISLFYLPDVFIPSILHDYFDFLLACINIRIIWGGLTMVFGGLDPSSLNKS